MNVRTSQPVRLYLVVTLVLENGAAFQYQSSSITGCCCYPHTALASMSRQEAQIDETQEKLESERRASTEKVDALTVSHF